MDVDDDDDFYAPEESTPVVDEAGKPKEEPSADAKTEHDDEGLEEGEEEDEAGEDDSDSDIDIITERKDGSKPAPPLQAKYNEIRNIAQRSTATDSITKAPTAKKEASTKDQVSGANLPGVATSKIDVDAKPIYEPAGKPITQVNIDEDLGENDKPWRRPGSDVTDYFNYGFDEFTWALYSSKQDTLRKDYAQEALAQDQKRMYEQMNMMMGMGGLPGMPGMPGGGAGGMPMEGITPEMQQMMQQMMASGMDPSQMDPSSLFGQGNAGGGNQGQGFGGQGFGQGQNQQMGYGFDQGGGDRSRGGFGRGRGGRRGR